MDTVAVTDTLIRGAAIALFLVALPFSWWPQRCWAGPAALAATSLGVASYLLMTSPVLDLCCGDGPPLWLKVPALMTPTAVWWAAQLIFSDRLEPTPWRWIITGVMVFLCAVHLVWPPFILPCLAASVCLYIHLLWLAVTSDADDLVPTRRLFRRVFVGSAAVVGTVVAASEFLQYESGMQDTGGILQAIVFLGLGGTFLALVAQRQPNLWPAPADPSRETAPPAKPQLSPAECALLARLNAAMTAEVWREEGLTIGGLAAKLDAPEHRLRRVINGGLGYRNFASFVNEHRIDAARVALADPSQAETPVLTLAYDVGFASLGPFNRAFREATGQSPTEYRRQHTATA